MKKLLAVLLLGLTIVSVGQEKVLLRLNYEKGDVYEMNMKMTQNMGVGVMSMNTTMTMSQEIKDVSDKEYESTMKITKMVMDMSQGGMQMSYDSSKKGEELDQAGKMMKAQMEPMLKATITAKGDKLGKILETKVVPNIPGASDLTKQSSNVTYPEKAVAVGDTWSMIKDSKGMKFNFVYKVTSISSKSVLLNVSGKVEGIATGDITGSMRIDRKSGVPVNSKIDMIIQIQGQELKTNVEMNIVKQ